MIYVETVPRSWAARDSFRAQSVELEEKLSAPISNNMKIHSGQAEHVHNRSLLHCKGEPQVLSPGYPWIGAHCPALKHGSLAITQRVQAANLAKACGASP